MIDFQRSASVSAIAVMILLHFGSSVSYSQGAPSREKFKRKYYAEVLTYSIVPQKGIDTYQSHGKLGVASGLTVETGVFNGTQRFQVVTSCRMKSKNFIATFTVKDLSGGDGKVVEKLTREFDLTDLKPEVIEIARDDDGRVYRVNIIPRVNEMPVAKVFSAEDQKLDEWSFSESVVILNDQDYLGSLTISGGNLAFLEIPGLAHIDLSLIPLKDAVDEGSLQDGTITIRHEQLTLVINNVRNGNHGQTLNEGPYKVFVRWNSPTETVKQYRENLKSHIENLKAKFNDGDTTVSKTTINRLQQMVDSDRILLLKGGVRTVNPDEIDRTVQPIGRREK